MPPKWEPPDAGPLPEAGWTRPWGAQPAQRGREEAVQPDAEAPRDAEARMVVPPPGRRPDGEELLEQPLEGAARAGAVPSELALREAALPAEFL